MAIRPRSSCATAPGWWPRRTWCPRRRWQRVMRAHW